MKDFVKFFGPAAIAGIIVGYSLMEVTIFIENHYFHFHENPIWYQIWKGSDE